MRRNLRRSLWAEVDVSPSTRAEAMARLGYSVDVDEARQWIWRGDVVLLVEAVRVFRDGRSFVATHTVVGQVVLVRHGRCWLVASQFGPGYRFGGSSDRFLLLGGGKLL